MHIGLIPDGNRRYMKKKGIANLTSSYEMGINKFYDFAEWSMELGIKEVTVYTLSLENIENRGAIEIGTLLSLLSKHAVEILGNRFIKDGAVRVKICGDRKRLKEASTKTAIKNLLENLENLEEKTKNNKKLILNFAIAYGGRQEIIEAVKSVVEEGAKITEENIKKHLWIKDYPEVIVRTSEARLSNFLPWQSAYSEIYFVDKLWQEFDKKDLEAVIKDYRSKERRFGK